MQSAAIINYPCAVCGQPTTQWCSRCQSAWYCSPEHSRDVSSIYRLHLRWTLTQWQDWATHRHQCFPPPSGHATYNINTISAPQPVIPDLIAITAIYFDPAQGTLFRRFRIGACEFVDMVSPIEHTDLITVHCLPSQKQSYNICPVPLLTQYFPYGLPEAILLTQGLNGENLRFPLHLWYCPESHKRGSPANRSVHRITSNVARKAWCGPVVVLKFNGSRRLGYTDASSNDLPVLSAYFINYE